MTNQVHKPSRKELLLKTLEHLLAETTEEKESDFHEPELPPVIAPVQAVAKRGRGRPRKTPVSTNAIAGVASSPQITRADVERAERKMFKSPDTPSSEPPSWQETGIAWNGAIAQGLNGGISEGDFNLSTKEGILAKFGTLDAAIEVLVNKFREHEHILQEHAGLLRTLTSGRIMGA